jgi:hypothetical protein
MPAIPPTAASQVGSKIFPFWNLNAIRTVTTISPLWGS